MSDIIGVKCSYCGKKEYYLYKKDKNWAICFECFKKAMDNGAK